MILLTSAAAQVQIQQISLALLSASNLRYVSAEQAGTDPLTADRTAIGPWEQFYKAFRNNTPTHMQAKANGRFVTAESGGAQPLIASRTQIGSWEEFYGPKPPPNIF
jgi:hypothetical protein